MLYNDRRKLVKIMEKPMENELSPAQKLKQSIDFNNKDGRRSEGYELRKARLNAGLTQEEIAYAMKVRQTTVSGWERGENKISTDNAQQLIALLNIPQTDESSK